MFKIQTERCNIEWFGPEHISEAVELFTNPAVREYLGGPVPEGYARKRLEGWTDRSNVREPHFAVMSKESGALLGVVDIAPYHEPGKEELSYMFLPHCWGQGYAEESIRAILQYCKEELHMDYVVSETQEKNIRSRRLLERLGYTLEKQVERFGAAQCVYVRTL